jgi:hypothetical protein
MFELRQVAHKKNLSEIRYAKAERKNSLFFSIADMKKRKSI